jgi:hypothetical protein
MVEAAWKLGVTAISPTSRERFAGSESPVTCTVLDGSAFDLGFIGDLPSMAPGRQQLPAWDSLQPIPEQRGLEQMLYNQYNPPLNLINPISPSNPNLNNYMDAASMYLQSTK